MPGVRPVDPLIIATAVWPFPLEESEPVKERKMTGYVNPNLNAIEKLFDEREPLLMPD